MEWTTASSRQIRQRDPGARVIVLTTYDTDEDIARALKAGAKADVLKDITASALITCIHDVLAGKTYRAPIAAAKLAESRGADGVAVRGPRTTAATRPTTRPRCFIAVMRPPPACSRLSVSICDPAIKECFDG